jgi:hypothetical protein
MTKDECEKAGLRLISIEKHDELIAKGIPFFRVAECSAKTPCPVKKKRNGQCKNKPFDECKHLSIYIGRAF